MERISQNLCFALNLELNSTDDHEPSYKVHRVDLINDELLLHLPDHDSRVTLVLR